MKKGKRKVHIVEKERKRPLFYALLSKVYRLKILTDGRIHGRERRTDKNSHAVALIFKLANFSDFECALTKSLNLVTFNLT